MSASDQSSADEAAAKDSAASGFPVANRVTAIGPVFWLMSRSILRNT
jgi:hypothetical protein